MFSYPAARDFQPIATGKLTTSEKRPGEKGMSVSQNSCNTETLHIRHLRNGQGMLYHEKQDNPPHKRSSCDKDPKHLVSYPCPDFPKYEGITTYLWQNGKAFRFSQQQRSRKMTEFMKECAKKKEIDLRKVLFSSVLYYD